MISEREKQEITEVYLERGIQQGIKRGIEQGIEQGKKDTAKRMLERGFKVSDIAEITGLTLDEIRSILARF